uniref:Uncharacterized protein n=1 Tax=Ananas comosus var. bracteatus TaxID=296719 RepID=A0A6V7PVH7_ANACO|nr:unnamed protein product [Ananas comosus var. bracteatus]
MRLARASLEIRRFSNNLLFRSFQISQKVSAMARSKSNRFRPVASCLSHLHREAKLGGNGCLLGGGEAIRRRRPFHTKEAYLHKSKRCCVVSASELHNTQIVGPCHPRLSRFSAVKILFFSASQINSFTFNGILSFQRKGRLQSMTPS